MYKKEDWMNKYFIQKPVEETEYVSCQEEVDKVDRPDRNILQLL